MTPSKAMRMTVIQVLIGILVCLTVSSSASGADERRLQSVNREHPIHRSRRASSFIRIGKSRPSSSSAAATNVQELLDSLDINSDGLNDVNEEKRASSFVRIGKSAADEREMSLYPEAEDHQMKRASSFVRIGRQPHQSSASAALSSAPRKSDDFGRKRMSSFVRIGKRHENDYALVAADESQRSPTWSASETEVATGGSDGPKLATLFSSTACDGDVERCKPVVSQNDDSVAIPDKKASSFIRIGRNADGQ